MFDDPELKEWLDAHAKDSGDKIENSAMMCSVMTPNALKDPLCALQIGYAILLDKPIVLIADETMEIPKHLIKIATAIEKIRLGNAQDMARAQGTIRKIMEQFK